MSTIKNKLYAMALVSIGVITLILGRDATVLVFVSIFAIPLFLSKQQIV